MVILSTFQSRSIFFKDFVCLYFSYMNEWRQQICSIYSSYPKNNRDKYPKGSNVKIIIYYDYVRPVLAFDSTSQDFKFYSIFTDPVCLFWLVNVPLSLYTKAVSFYISTSGESEIVSCEIFPFQITDIHNMWHILHLFISESTFI